MTSLPRVRGVAKEDLELSGPVQSTEDRAADEQDATLPTASPF